MTELPTHHVDCWMISPAELPAHEGLPAAGALSHEERSYAVRLRCKEDQRRYVAAHLAVRHLIARYTGCAPAVVSIRPDLHGRPILEHSNCGLHFNLSHSGGWVLAAFSTIGPVGVDVERVRESVDLIAIARSHFSLLEVGAIGRLPPDQRATAFYRTWTRKEAFVKAVGLGLSFPLQAFSTGQPDHPARLTGRNGELWEDWTLADVPVDAEHVGALAIRRGSITVRSRRAEWSWLLSGQFTS